MFLSTGKLVLLKPERPNNFLCKLGSELIILKTKNNFPKIFSYLKKKEVNFWSLKLTYLKKLFVIVGLKLLIPPTCFFLKSILAEARIKKKKKKLVT